MIGRLGYNVIREQILLAQRNKGGDYLKKKWLVRISAYTGYSILIVLALFYLVSLAAVLMLAILDFQGA